MSKTFYYYNSHGKLDYAEISNSSDGIQRRYYLYDKNEIVGYFPSENKNRDELIPSMVLFDQKKLLQLNEVGIDAFKKKYFTKTIQDSIINNCYTPIVNSQFLINDKPVKEFLKKMGKVNTKYIVFEIADNYFLFYKLLD